MLLEVCSILAGVATITPKAGRLAAISTANTGVVLKSLAGKSCFFYALCPTKIILKVGRSDCIHCMYIYYKQSAPTFSSYHNVMDSTRCSTSLSDVHVTENNKTQIPDEIKNVGRNFTDRILNQGVNSSNGLTFIIVCILRKIKLIALHTDSFIIVPLCGLCYHVCFFFISRLLCSTSYDILLEVSRGMLRH